MSSFFSSACFSAFTALRTSSTNLQLSPHFFAMAKIDLPPHSSSANISRTVFSSCVTAALASLSIGGSFALILLPGPLFCATGLVLGFIGLSQRRRRHGFAIVGVIANGLGLVLSVAIIFAAIAAAGARR